MLSPSFSLPWNDHSERPPPESVGCGRVVASKAEFRILGSLGARLGSRDTEILGNSKCRSYSRSCCSIPTVRVACTHRTRPVERRSSSAVQSINAGLYLATTPKASRSYGPRRRPGESTGGLPDRAGLRPTQPQTVRTSDDRTRAATDAVKRSAEPPRSNASRLNSPSTATRMWLAAARSLELNGAARSAPNRRSRPWRQGC